MDGLSFISTQSDFKDFRKGWGIAILRIIIENFEIRQTMDEMAFLLRLKIIKLYPRLLWREFLYVYVEKKKHQLRMKVRD